MGEENIERLRAIYAEWAEGNFRAGAELLAPDGTFKPLSDGRETLDREAVEVYMRDFFASWSDFRTEAEEFVDFGDTILVTERQRAAGKSSGIKTEQVVYAAWTFRDGLVIHLRWDRDRATALEAAGLEE
jgi:ketosteroid isomerase-like protein